MRRFILASLTFISFLFLPWCDAAIQDQVTFPPVVVGREQKFSQDELDSLVRTEVHEGWQALSDELSQNFCCILSAQEIRITQVALEYFDDVMDVPVDSYMFTLQRHGDAYRVELTPRYEEQEQFLASGYWFPESQFHILPIYYIVVSRDTLEVLESGEVIQ